MNAAWFAWATKIEVVGRPSHVRQKAATGTTDNMVPPQLRLARARKTHCSPRAERHLSLAKMSAPSSLPQPQALAARGCTHASGRLGSKSLWMERTCREHDCLLFPDYSSLCLNKGTCRRLAISLACALGAPCTFGLAAVRHSRRGLHVGALPAANIAPPAPSAPRAELSHSPRAVISSTQSSFVFRGSV